MKKEVTKENQPSHVSKGNVLDDLGLSPQETAALKLKMDLHGEILKVIKKKKLTPRMLETALHQPQPRISELLRGKISTMSAEKLAGYLYLLGVAVTVSSKKVTIRSSQPSKVTAGARAIMRRRNGRK